MRSACLPRHPAVAYLFLVRAVIRIVASALLVFGAALSVSGQQQPTDDVFTHSSRELAFQIPAGFQLVSEDRRYLRPEMHEVPRWQRMWQHGSDGIIVNVVVVPDISWQTKPPKQIFDEDLRSMFSIDPNLKVVSQRNYELDGAPAVSVTCFYPGGTSQRMDCFLAKPNMFMVAYVSSKPSSWDDAASKGFFQTVSLKPKK
jgi:hypothetical protein